eukprot:12906075-Prorocentrum_lima.AAC.1
MAETRIQTHGRRRAPCDLTYKLRAPQKPTLTGEQVISWKAWLQLWQQPPWRKRNRFQSFRAP